MLLIRAIQVESVNGVCTYKVAAFINARPIWEGLVGAHQRSQGWAVLAGHIAHAAGLQTPEQKRTIEESLKLVAGEEIRCPACNQVLGRVP